MKMYWGVEIQLHTFLTSAPDWVNGQFHVPATLPPKEKAPGTHLIGGWVGPRAVLDTGSEEKNS